MNKIFLYLITIISCFTIYLNYEHYRGFVDQLPIMSDRNAILNYSDVSDLKEYLPNITATTIPIYENKLLYLLNSLDSIDIDSLKSILINYSSPNPYLGLKERILADLYAKKGDSDSARFYYEIAFNKLPNNEIYNTNYFNLLADIKDSVALKSAFKKIKIAQKITLKNYINNSMRVLGYNNTYVNYLIDSLLTVYPIDEEIKELSIINKIGHSFYKKSQLEEVLAQKDFENEDYKSAVKGFLKVNELNPFNPIAFENLAISYMKLSDLERARSNFKIVIDSFELKTGKSEFYYGVLNLEIDKKKACKYLKIANKLEFSGAEAFINKYCNN